MSRNDNNVQVRGSQLYWHAAIEEFSTVDLRTYPIYKIYKTYILFKIYKIYKICIMEILYIIK